jgi:23S rRNA (guanine2445-N2)-methyltransferase / 23S rRNA (guanine2069-N7)-methyltransferase
MTAELRLFATSPKGVASVLLMELQALGATELRESVAGVAFSGTLEAAYRACLWSRTANRILLQMTQFAAPDAQALYRGVAALPWQEHLAPGATLAVDFNSRRSQITHTHFGALKVKDAIVDVLRTEYGERPSVDTEKPSVRVNVFVDRDVASVSIDLSGSSLHERGYRTEAGVAPLKENLAAAILLRLRWLEVAACGGGLIDPMCGSGTFLVEAALMAGDIAPALARDYFGFAGWKGHRADLWNTLLQEARDRAAAGREKIPPIVGSDSDGRVLRVARSNITRAGLADVVRLQEHDIEALRPIGSVPGLVVVNPPYGERLGEQHELAPLYATLGRVLGERFSGWQAGVFTGNPDLGKRMGLRARRRYSLYNGALECRLLCFDVAPEWIVEQRQAKPSAPVLEGPLSAGAQMLANRLRKNLRSLGAWAEREGIACYRLYDADMPEYAFAVDVYQAERRFVHVQEYAPPATISAESAEKRRQEALAAIPRALDVAAADMFIKVRRRQKDGAQYEKHAAAGEFHTVSEGGCRFIVNFGDYLDTGLFLDHRITRRMIAELASGRHFLNLFGYTGSATVFAAAASAQSTTHVDMSHTYIDWARRNMLLNGFHGTRYQFVQADCLAWLAEAGQDPRQRGHYGLIFVDPPTFSRSKRMEGVFDVQRDHVAMLKAATLLLAPAGELIFSTNLRTFKLDVEGLAPLLFRDITAQTIPKDFARNARIHHCFRLEKAP